jgi:tRNA threonylcarbamoyladenosine modification (KEOPS) complex  Pcc1 subunit
MFLLENSKFEHNHNKNRLKFHLSVDDSESDTDSHNSWLLWRKISLSLKDVVIVSLF